MLFQNWNILIWFLCPTDDLQTLQASAVTGRRRLLTTTVPSNQVANPAICIELNQMIFFKVSINSTSRASSNYPVYVVNHLYNTNPTFDYGAFTQLAYLIANTNVTITSFAHVFTESGTYVFQDAQDSSLWVLLFDRTLSVLSFGMGRLLCSLFFVLRFLLCEEF